MRVIILLLMLGVSACSSIPVSTMLSMASFGPDDFVKLNPDEVQTRITLDTPLSVNTTKTKIEVEVQQPQGTLVLPFSLKVIGQQTLPADNSWLSSKPQRNQYLLRLTDDAKASFIALQQKVAQQGTSGLGLSVAARLDGREENGLTHGIKHMTIELKLSAEQGFFTLFEDVELDMSQTRQDL